MCPDVLSFKVFEKVGGNLAVDRPLVRNAPFFLGIECRCVVLEVLDQRPGISPVEQDLGLSFVNFPFFQEISFQCTRVGNVDRVTLYADPSVPKTR